VGCYPGGLCKVCHKCVTDVHKRLKKNKHFITASTGIFISGSLYSTHKECAAVLVQKCLQP
jgi:hypothetical protein